MKVIDKVLAQLPADPTSADDIAEVVEANVSTVRKALNKLVEENAAVVTMGGRKKLYSLNNATRLTLDVAAPRSEKVLDVVSAVAEVPETPPAKDIPKGNWRTHARRVPPVVQGQRKKTRRERMRG